MDQIQKKLLILIGSSLIVLVLGTVFALRPLLNDIKFNVQMMKSQEKLADFFQIQTKKLQEIERVYSSSQLVSQKLGSLFVNPKAPLSFIQFLETTAAQQGLTLELTPQGESKIQSWPAIQFSVSAQGQFPACVRFLGQLENAPFLIEIPKVRLSQPQKQEKAGDSNVILALSLRVASFSNNGD